MGDLETELIARNTLALGAEVVPGGAAGAVVAADRRRTRAGAGARPRGPWRAVLRGWAAAVGALPATLRARAEVRRRTRGAAGAGGVVTGRIVRR